MSYQVDRDWLFSQMIGGFLRRRVESHLAAGGVVIGYEGDKVSMFHKDIFIIGASSLADMIMRLHFRGGRVEFGQAGPVRLSVCGY